MIDANLLTADIDRIRERSPLIHNITNYVVMNNTANALLALGASPVMAHAPEEVEEMTAMASALVLNIGTLSREWIRGMMLAGSKAREKKIPVILDPVGAGATNFRTKTCQELIKSCRPGIIRGNGSEIMALVSRRSRTKGVDSLTEAALAVDQARQLARETKAIVVVSGPTDYITDGVQLKTVTNGSSLMTRVTGLGCTASALTGAFAAVNNDLFLAAVHAMVVMGMAGERAAKACSGPGSLQLQFLDELYGLNKQKITKQLKS
ncbi:MAG: hydroxyethylthiazole kinase [Mangrovibacterium sp.]